MNRKLPVRKFELYTDAVYSATFPNSVEIINTFHPATVVTDQTSWRENTSARVRKTLEDMLPHDFRMVEGVDVRKYSSRSGNGVLYQVNGESNQLTLSAAIMRVCAVIANR